MERRTLIQRKLLRWYATYRRDLPWRRTRDPYAILISEVMLQQTQVERVVPKYRAFLTQFPTLRHLARSSQADVLRAWSGLGYNRRARNLHQLAKQVVAHEGKLPTTPQALLALPGIGPYTAAAVACFAFQAPVALVDVNVRRVLGRLTKGVRGQELLTEKQLWKLAAQYVPPQQSVAWNSALMDFGAITCTARAPKCATCPLQPQCKAFPKILNVQQAAKRVEPFVGSRRYWRGQVVTLLRERARTHRMLIRHFVPLGLAASDLDVVLKSLHQDGLVRKHRGTYTL